MSDESFIKVNINLEKPTQLRPPHWHSALTSDREKKTEKSRFSGQILDCQTVGHRLKMRGMAIIGMLVHIPSIGKALQTDLVYSLHIHTPLY